MQNKDIVRRSYELFAEGRIAEAAELYAPDAVWTFPGQNALTGEYTGRDAIVNEFLPKLFGISGGTYRATLMDVADGDGHTFALQHSQAERDGQSIDYVLCNVISIEGGLIRTVHTYPWDASAQDAFWRRTLLRKRGPKGHVKGESIVIPVTPEAVFDSLHDAINAPEYEDLAGEWF
ncbi:hypothetical protein GCM10023346_21160 [Arthrobacter gyeryongensis]|uniref:SnoaL-like domain-containing protein n=1 Tax=Arthrobacter gyeryongensis TaxID=1650592 RepID=A0ABP9SDF9_9MICC